MTEDQEFVRVLEEADVDVSNKPLQLDYCYHLFSYCYYYRYRTCQIIPTCPIIITIIITIVISSSINLFLLRGPSWGLGFWV